MPTPFIMPKFDMDQEKATVISWLKHEGDRVKQDEPVLVVETDKVAIDVPAPATGTLVGLRVNEGDVVPVTTIIAYVLAEGETLEAIPSTPDAPRQTRPHHASPKTFGGERPPPAATPVARRMAQEHGIDVTQIPARRGKVTKADVERQLRRKSTADDRYPATPAARRVAREQGIDLRRVTGSGPDGRIQAADVQRAGDISSWVEDDRQAEVIPLTGMRRTIAERMTASFQQAPHIALTVELDVGALESARVEMNKGLRAGAGEPVALTAVLVCLVARTLEAHPYLNASLVGEEIHLWKEINVGVATAVPGGLVVPVIRHANRLSVIEAHAQLQRLATQAREDRLALHDVRGGTFSITNLGMFGVRQFRAVINPPESAILAVGAAVRRPVVIDDHDTVGVRTMIALTLSADHRVVDGVMAAEFLRDLGQAIEAPGVLLNEPSFKEDSR